MRKTLLASLLLTSGILSAHALFSISPESKIDSFLLKEMQSNLAGKTYPILVILKEQAQLSDISVNLTKEERGQLVYQRLTEVALRTQSDLNAMLTEKGTTFQRFYITNMIAVFDASDELIRELAARSDVDKVINNAEQQFIDVPSKAARVQAKLDQGEDEVPHMSENIGSVGADKVWKEFNVTGAGIVVAGQDTGVDWQHPALKSHYRGASNSAISHDYNWHDAIRSAISAGTTNRCGYDLKVPCDDGDHGSHTLGTVVGDDGQGNAIGMAPGSKWIACRNMDEGNGRPSTYNECFQFFLAPYPVGGNAFTDGNPAAAPHVINNSWGCPRSEGCTGIEVQGAMRALKTAGVMVVVSAGNDGSSCSTIKDPPAYHSVETFTVGAVDHRDWRIAYFSSRGPSTFDGQIGPDVTAPGVSVRSSVPGGTYEEAMWSGTSMAGPHVAGLVALLWSAKPALIGKIDETAEIIRKTARPTKSTQNCGGVSGDKVPNNTFGYGIIDAYAAVKSVRN